MLVDRYAIAVDRRDAAALAELFVEDCGLDVYLPGRDAPAAQLRGVDQITGVLGAIGVYRETMHVVANFVPTVDGDQATGIVYCLALHFLDTEDDSRDEVMVLTYDDRYVRTASGWRFAFRTLHRKWNEWRPAGRAPLQMDLVMGRRGEQR
jgi:hypothetical protein